MANSRVKSVSFRKDEDKLLKYANTIDKFSDHVKNLLKQEMEQGYKPPKQVEEYFIKLIKKYSPTASESEIKVDVDNIKYDKETLDAVNQFDTI